VLVVVVAHGSGSACAGASAHALFALSAAIFLQLWVQPETKRHLLHPVGLNCFQASLLASNGTDPSNGTNPPQAACNSFPALVAAALVSAFALVGAVAFAFAFAFDVAFAFAFAFVFAFASALAVMCENMGSDDVKGG
jgi:hypothetical protein